MTVHIIPNKYRYLGAPETKVGDTLTWADLYRTENYAIGDTIIWQSATGHSSGTVVATGTTTGPAPYNWADVILDALEVTPMCERL